MAKRLSIMGPQKSGMQLDGRRVSINKNTLSTTIQNQDDLSFSGKFLDKGDKITSASRLKLRKVSYGFSSIQGIRNVERRMSGVEYKRPLVIFYPTYQLDPLPQYHFDRVRVEKFINLVLDEGWEGHKYHEAESPALAMSISNYLMRKIKLMNFNRYRILVVCFIGQKRSQSYFNAVSFLWDPERDRYVDVHRSDNNTAFIQVTVFGVYLD